MPPNRTGLPQRLKNGVESLSGIAIDRVRVHYDSDKPAQLQSFAFTRGTNIYVAPGQERHLPHETWHAVQQLQGRVSATTQMKGFGVNEDAVLEREADVMGQRALQVNSHSTTDSQQPASLGLGVVQRVKVPPVGNFARYTAGQLTNTGITAGLHPNQAEVATQSKWAAVSAPVNSLGWAQLDNNNYTLNGGPAGTVNTRIEVWPRIEQNGNNYTRMHLIHHALASNANANANNIVLGPATFNRVHVSHVENFLGDSLGHNFYTSTGNNNLAAMLLNGEALGRTPPAHANPGRPYVVGAAPTFPASLRTGVVLANTHGVPANAQEITTDETVLDHHVTLWYEVVPVFAMGGLALYTSMVNQLNAAYLARAGAVVVGEVIPGGILGGAGMLRGMADALAGSYATALTVRISFYYPDPDAIPAAGTTADNLPWREARTPVRTLANPAGNPTWQYDMQYDAGMGILSAANPVVAQL